MCDVLKTFHSNSQARTMNLVQITGACQPSMTGRTRAQTPNRGKKHNVALSTGFSCPFVPLGLSHCRQCRSMRSWSPNGPRGLEKRSSVDGFVYKGRFRIRDVSLSGNYTPSATSVTSISSAPAASRDVQVARRASARPAAAAAAPDGCIASPDLQSDISDYSFYVAASEVSENDETGRLGNSDKSGRDDRLSPGETSEASGGYDSELGRKFLVSPTAPNEPNFTVQESFLSFNGSGKFSHKLVTCCPQTKYQYLLRRGCTFFFFSLPIIVSVACPTGPHPPLRLARRPNRGHIGGGGWTPSCGTCLRCFYLCGVGYT